jgi:desampylase
MKVCISRGLLQAIVDDARLTPGLERCGLLFSADQHITAFQPAQNISTHPDQEFLLDPAALIAAHRAARQAGPALFGHYHFHPNGLNAPSLRDAEQSDDRTMHWMIVTPESYSLWRISPGATQLGRFAPLRLEVTD